MLIKILWALVGYNEHSLNSGKCQDCPVELNGLRFWEESSGVGRYWKYYIFHRNRTANFPLLFCSASTGVAQTCEAAAVAYWVRESFPHPRRTLSSSYQNRNKLKIFSIFASPHLRIFLHLLFRDKSLPLKIHLVKWFSQPQGMVQEGLQSRIQSSWRGCRSSRRSGDEWVHSGARITFYMLCSYIYFQLAVSETHTLTSVAMPITIKQFPLQDSVLPSVFLSPKAVHRLLALEDMN